MMADDLSESTKVRLRRNQYDSRYIRLPQNHTRRVTKYKKDDLIIKRLDNLKFRIEQGLKA